MYYCNLLNGYSFGNDRHKIASPTKFYLDSFGCGEDWRRIEQMSENMLPRDRIIYGLSDKNNELERIVEDNKKIYLKLCGQKLIDC